MDKTNLKIFEYLEKNKQKFKKPKTHINVILLTIKTCKKIIGKNKTQYSHVVAFLPKVADFLHDNKIINDDLFVTINEFDNEDLINLIEDLMSIKGCFVKYL